MSSTELNTVMRICKRRLRNKNMVQTVMMALNASRPNNPHVDSKVPSPVATPKALNAQALPSWLMKWPVGRNNAPAKAMVANNK